MKFLFTIALLVTGGLATGAFAAEQDSSWYGSVSGDVAFPRDTAVTGTTDGNIKYKFSSGGNVALGYEPYMLNNATGDTRFEIEGGYHAFGLKDVTAGGVTNTSPTGDLKVMTLMGNAYYDLHTGTSFTPYIGAGVGDANIHLSKNNGFGAITSSDNRLGYQFMTGVSYTPQSMPHTDWSLGYRYLGTTSPQFTTSTGHVKLDAIHASNIEVGFKYHF
jgi:opacity protein-like surface antigen